MGLLKTILVSFVLFAYSLFWIALIIFVGFSELIKYLIDTLERLINYLINKKSSSKID